MQTPISHSNRFRIFAALCLLSVLGCGQSPPQVATHASPATETRPALPPTTPIGVEGKTLSFDPKTCTRGEARFDWGLGSAKVKVLGHQAGHCVFEFTDEVEGGYAVYRCRVPLDAGPVTIAEGTIREGDSSWPGIVTSFPRDEASIVRRGNVHFGWQELLVEGTPHYVSVLPEGGQASPQPAVGATLLLRFRVYTDDTFTALAPGAKQRQEVSLVLGRPHDWKWIAPAIEGIQVGERRRLRLHSRIADGARQWLPTLLDGESLYLEMDLASATGP